MSVKAVSYIEAVKKKPGLFFHIALFGVMCILNVAVWRSLEQVFPDGAELGKFAIVGRSLCIAILIAIIVRAADSTVKRALFLMVIAVALEAGEFGCHWMYARELSTSRMAQGEIDRQLVRDNDLANQKAKRDEGILSALAQFNQSQSKLNQSDAQLYRAAGVRKNRPVVDPGKVLGLERPVSDPRANPQPQPTPMVNGLSTSVAGVTLPSQQAPVEDERPLSELQVLAKWTPRFVIAAILCLVCVFVGTAIVLATWETDMNANGIADSLEGKA